MRGAIVVGGGLVGLAGLGARRARQDGHHLREGSGLGAALVWSQLGRRALGPLLHARGNWSASRRGGPVASCQEVRERCLISACDWWMLVAYLGPLVSVSGRPCLRRSRHVRMR